MRHGEEAIVSDRVSPAVKQVNAIDTFTFSPVWKTPSLVFACSLG
jgi:hypothetical protein